MLNLCGTQQVEWTLSFVPGASTAGMKDGKEGLRKSPQARKSIAASWEVVLHRGQDRSEVSKGFFFLFCKGPDSKYFQFCGQMISVPTPHLCQSNMKSAIHDM